MAFARIKPYDGKSFVLQTYTVFGIKFQEKNGWYQVDDDVARYLKTCVQIQEDPTSKPAFDVVETLEEAEEIDELEQLRAERAKARDARPAKRVHQVGRRNALQSMKTSGDLTTKDLQAPARSELAKEHAELSESFDDDMAATPAETTPEEDMVDGEEEETDVDDADLAEDEDEEAEEDEDSSKEKPPAKKKSSAKMRGIGRKK